jgi:hypothetical protein
MTTATLTLLHDTSPHGTGLFYVNVQVADLDLDLGAYTTLSEAAQRMGDWVRQRGMHWCPDTAARLNACTAADSPVLTLNARTHTAPF